MKKQTNKKVKEVKLMRKVLMTSLVVSVIGSSMGSTLNVFASQNQVKNAVETVNKKKEARVATLGQNDSQLLKNTAFDLNATETNLNNWTSLISGEVTSLEREQPDGSTGFYRLIGNSTYPNWIYLKHVTVSGEAAIQIWSRAGSVGGSSPVGEVQQDIDLIQGRTYLATTNATHDASSSTSRNANSRFVIKDNGTNYSTGWVTLGAGQTKTYSKEFVAQSNKASFSLQGYSSAGDQSGHTATNFSKSNFAEKYHIEWNLVDNLFTDLTHTTIKPTVTTTEVEAAKAEVDKMATSVDKTAMLKLLQTADEQANVAKPTFNPINNTQTELTGKARPHAKVTIETRSKLKLAYSTDADENGDFKFILPKQPAGSKITGTQTVGDRTSEIAEVIVSDAIPYAQPTTNG